MDPYIAATAYEYMLRKRGTEVDRDIADAVKKLGECWLDEHEKNKRMRAALHSLRRRARYGCLDDGALWVIPIIERGLRSE